MSPASNLWQCDGKPIGSFVDGFNTATGLDKRFVELAQKDNLRYSVLAHAYFEIAFELRAAFFRGEAVLVYRSDKPQLWMVQATQIPKPPTES